MDFGLREKVLISISGRLVSRPEILNEGVVPHIVWQIPDSFAIKIRVGTVRTVHKERQSVNR
jgi:hypothetical protein